jgi:hypothetical protein
MFDEAFFRVALPDLVTAECRRQPNRTPVVELRLGDCGALDVCHVGRLDEKWLAIAFYRDPRTCEDMDYAFLPYELVTRVTVSLHSREQRKLGFQALPGQAKAWLEVTPAAANPRQGA